MWVSRGVASSSTCPWEWCKSSYIPARAVAWARKFSRTAAGSDATPLASSRAAAGGFAHPKGSPRRKAISPNSSSSVMSVELAAEPFELSLSLRDSLLSGLSA